MAFQGVCKPVKCTSHSNSLTRAGQSTAIGHSLDPARRQQQRFGESAALFVSSGKSAAPILTRIASRFESCAQFETVDPEPNLDNNIAAVALDGVSFAPAGLLYPYYVGVGAALQDLRLINDNTRRDRIAEAVLPCTQGEHVHTGE